MGQYWFIAMKIDLVCGQVTRAQSLKALFIIALMGCEVTHGIQLVNMFAKQSQELGIQLDCIVCTVHTECSHIIRESCYF